MRIGVIPGSIRQNNNGVGIVAWATSLVLRAASSTNSSLAVAPTAISLPSPSVPSFPLGPVIDPVIAQAVKNPAQYASPQTQEWSKFVSGLSGLVIVTPQYNWGYPGELKNALDHLYNEWSGKPIVIVSYGGHGGGKARVQLEQVLQGGFKARVVGAVEVTLPSTYIRGEHRVGKEDSKQADKFLDEYEGAVVEAIGKLFEVASAKEEQKRDEL